MLHEGCDVGLIGDDEADGEIVTLLEQALARYGAGNRLTGPALRQPRAPAGPQPLEPAPLWTATLTTRSF